MARTVYRVQLFFRSIRSAATNCLLLILTVCIIKLIFLFPILHITKNHSFQLLFRRRHENLSSCAGGFSPDAGSSWRPDMTKVRQILHYLNLTEEEVQQNLPLSLESPLLLNNASLCGTDHDDPVDLLFMVHSSPQYIQRRIQMRDTITREWFFRPFKVRAVFLVGRVTDNRVQEVLEREHAFYGDMVQGDFIDSYQNLSHKGVLGFRWVSQFCAGVRHVVKIDDDVFFDTYKMLFRYRNFFEGNSRSLYCNVWTRNSMPINREGDSKWIVDRKHFQDVDTFPYDYCSGMTVILSGDLIPVLYRAAFFTPVFWIDDIYLFGMLPVVAGDVKMVNLGFMKKYMIMDPAAAFECMEHRQHQCPVMVASCYSAEEWDMMWNITYHLNVETNWRIPYLIVK